MLAVFLAGTVWSLRGRPLEPFAVGAGVVAAAVNVVAGYRESAG